MAPYPTKPEIQNMFSTLSTAGDFFAHVLDDVDWQVMGHSPLSRAYANKTEFQAATTKVSGRQGADGAVEDVRRQCCGRRGRGYGGSGDEG